MTAVICCAVLAAATVCAVPQSALAADVSETEDGSDACCDDLESRVTELETAAVKKGNRHVTLELSGHIHRALLFWDDGTEHDAYIIDPTNYGSYMQLSGEAKVSDDVTAGFILSLDFPDNESFSISQDVTSIPGTPIVGRVGWFLKHERLGRIAVGRETEAHDHISESDNSGTGLFTGPAVTDWNGSFRLTGPTAALFGAAELTWTSLSSASIGDGDNTNAIRYDTPTFDGVQFAVSWGRDDVVAVAATYSFDNEQIEFSAGVAVAHYPGADRSPCIDLDPVAGCTTVGGSASILHKASQISLSGAAGFIADDPRERRGVERDYWVYGKLAQEWSVVDLGGTVAYGEYFHGRHGGQIGLDPATAAADTASFSAETDVFGLGVMQFFDEAEMQIYAGWRTYHIDGEAVIGATRDTLQFERYQAFTLGTRISF
ncbi:MAG: hypothetical protein ACRCS9_10440 [Hyphomicrobium sp.]